MSPVNPAHVFTFIGTTHNVFHCNAGEGLPRHAHDFAHVSAVHAGRVAVRKEGLEFEMTPASRPILLSAVEWHEIEALEDGTVFENIFPYGASK